MDTEEAARPCAGEWAEIEARFQSAKRAMFDAQQRHCEASHEFLLARARVRQMLEAVFPGTEADSDRPVSEARRSSHQTQGETR